MVKVDSEILNIEEGNLKQIIKDLTRTYPDTKMFKIKENQIKMLNVLKAFSNYDSQIRRNIIINRICSRDEFYSGIFFVSL